MPKGKASPSKPDLPKKPPRPRPVQDEAVDAVRQANWQLAMNEWDEKIKAHDAAMYAREASKKRNVRGFWAHDQPSTKAAARPQSKAPTAASLASPRRSPRHSTALVPGSCSDDQVLPLSSSSPGVTALVASSSSDDQALPLSSSAPGVTALVASSSTAAAPSRSHPPTTRPPAMVVASTSSSISRAPSDAALSVEPRLLERMRDHPVQFPFGEVTRIMCVSDAYRRGESDCLCNPDVLPEPDSDCRCGRITAARLATQVCHSSHPKRANLPIRADPHTHSHHRSSGALFWRSMLVGCLSLERPHMTSAACTLTCVCFLWLTIGPLLWTVRCGSDTVPRHYLHGFWDDCQDDDWNGRPEYSEVHHRPEQLRQLEGHGQPPSPEELAALPWPQREWWSDRDRIVLLHEYVGSWPPMGHHFWEKEVLQRALTLWNVWDHSIDLSGCSIEGKGAYGPLGKGAYDLTGMRGYGVEVRAGVKLWKDVPAPGYRMLTSFPCCPRFLRPLMSPALLARSRLTDKGRVADKWGSLPQWLVHERQDAERASEVPLMPDGDSEWDCGEAWRLDGRTWDRHSQRIEDIRGWTMSTT